MPRPPTRRRRRGLVGAGLLRQFRVALDLPARRLHLTPPPLMIGFGRGTKALAWRFGGSDHVLGRASMKSTILFAAAAVAALSLGRLPEEGHRAATRPIRAPPTPR